MYKDPTDKELDNFISWESVMKIRKAYDRLCRDDFSSPLMAYNCLLRRLCLWLYTEIPPLRGSEYANTQILGDGETLPNDNTQLNYISGDKLYIYDHKTFHAYGPKIINLSPKLKSLIVKTRKMFSALMSQYKLRITSTDYFADDEKRPVKPFTQESDASTARVTPWLLPKSLTLAMNQNDLHVVLTSCFAPKNISTQMLRKIFIAHFLSENPTADERKRVAKIMGHSIEMQELVYTRFEKAETRKNDDTE
jgi:hypothetical protein